MVNLLPYALAGAAAGAGEGLVQQAKQNFQAMQEELRQTRLDERQTRSDNRADARQTRADTRADARTDLELGSISKFDVDSQGYKIGLNARGEATRIRDQDGNPVRQMAEKPGYSVKQDADGNLLYVPDRPGSPIVPVTDASGQPVTGKTPRDPNELTKQQQLGVYQRALKDNTISDMQDPSKAGQVDWGGVIGDLKVAGVPITPSIVARAERDLRKQLAEDVSIEAERRRGEDNLIMPDKPADYGGLTRDQWEKQELDRRVNERLVELGLADPQAMPQTQQATAGTTPGQSQPGDTGKPPPAPINPGQRTVGEVYFTPLKGPMRWMGNGWQAVQ